MAEEKNIELKEKEVVSEVSKEKADDVTEGNKVGKEESVVKEESKDEEKPVKEEKIVNAKDKAAEKLASSVKDNKGIDKKNLEDYRTLGKPSKTKKSESIVKKITSKSKKDDKKEVELDRVYIVPMRRGFSKVPHYKRAKKAVKTLKEFLAKHMKVEERDLNKVKVDIYLNNEIWFKGIKKPLIKVKVRAKKIDGIVYAELAEVPDVVKFKKAKDEKRRATVDPKKLNKVVSQEAAEEKVKAGREDKADKTETKEKEAATAEAGLEKNKEMANIAKHTSKAKTAKMDNMSATTQRKAMKK